MQPGWYVHPPLPHGGRAGGGYHAPGHTVVIGGMPGWQIVVIAAAALLAATAPVVLYRAWATWRRSQPQQPITGGDPA
jgi:hypothetical protein